MAEGKIDVNEPVINYFPEFSRTDDTWKAAIMVEHVMLHTAGFPMAPLGPSMWADQGARVEKMNSWRVDWQPGSRYVYHSTSAHWVLAELIDRVTGHDYKEELHNRVTGPLGLPRLLGIELVKKRQQMK